MKRRNFIKTTGLVRAGIGLAGSVTTASSSTVKNALPRWRGFNLLDYFSPDKRGGGRGLTTDEEFKWMVDWGFDFVRIPIR